MDKIKRIFFLGIILAMTGLFSTGCRNHTERGATVGGLMGAGVGAIVGDHTGHAGEGALIGAALGAGLGGIAGDQADQEEAARQAMFEQRLGRRIAGATTFNDVIKMSQAGLGENVIVTHIQRHGVQARPSADDMIALKGQGVSDNVLNAMQRSSTATEVPVATPVVYPAGPAVVPVPVPVHHCGPPHHWRRRAGVHVRF